MHTPTVLTVKNLPAYIASTLGPVAILGEHGHPAVITGEVEPSKALPGTYLVETEHGSLYLGSDVVIEVSNI